MRLMMFNNNVILMYLTLL